MSAQPAASSALLAAAAELQAVEAPSDALVRSFLAAHPLPALTDALAACEAGSEARHPGAAPVESAAPRCLAFTASMRQDESTLCGALDRLFSTPVGEQALPQALGFASVAVASPSEAVRVLAARQLGRLLRIDAAAHGATAVPALAELIADSSTRVASAAVTSLASVARSSAELAMTVACTECVVALARHRSATVRLRACELAARIAEASPQAAAGVARAGLLDGLLAELELSAPPCRDLLAALAALESLSQLVESPVLATGLGASALGVLPRLAALATATDGHELVLRARALVVCCRVAGALASHRREVPPYVLPAAASILTDTSVPRELLSAAMDGLAVLSESANGADMVALTPGALESLVACAAAGGSSALGSEPSHAAAHTLATIAGAERAAEAALLSPPAEAALQAAFQRGLAQLSASPTLGEVLWAALRRRGDAFVSDRVAAYRLTSALGRRGWAANDVCAHAQLLGALLDARGESGHRACTWRHAAVCALAGAFRDADAMQDGEAAAMQRRLAAAASGGPFGTARREAAAPQVALQQL